MRALACLAAVLVATLACAPRPALAEAADRGKPMQIDADRMSSDDAARISIFDGNVVLTQGTIRVLANRIVVHQDVDGFQHATATGNPVHFRQKTDPKDGQPAEWMQGHAQRIELDEHDQKIELFGNARVTRGRDKVLGNYILVDERSQYFSVKDGPDVTTGGGRGREFGQVTEAEEEIDLGDLPRELLLVALHQASDGDDRLDAALALERRGLEHRLDGLPLGRVDEAAGVDQHHVGRGALAPDRRAVPDELADEPLGVHRCLVAAEGDDAETHGDSI